MVSSPGQPAGRTIGNPLHCCVHRAAYLGTAGAALHCVPLCLQLSDWDRYAAEEYELLVAEEGGQDPQEDL